MFISQQTDEILADLLTKALDAETFRGHVYKMGIHLLENNVEAKQLQRHFRFFVIYPLFPL